MSKILLSELLASQVFKKNSSKPVGVVGDVIFSDDLSKVQKIIIFDMDSESGEGVVDISEVSLIEPQRLQLSPSAKLCNRESDLIHCSPINTEVTTTDGQIIGKIKDVELENFVCLNIFVDGELKIEPAFISARTPRYVVLKAQHAHGFYTGTLPKELSKKNKQTIDDALCEQSSKSDIINSLDPNIPIQQVPVTQEYTRSQIIREDLPTTDKAHDNSKQLENKSKNRKPKKIKPLITISKSEQPIDSQTLVQEIDKMLPNSAVFENTIMETNTENPMVENLTTCNVLQSESIADNSSHIKISKSQPAEKKLLGVNDEQHKSDNQSSKKVANNKNADTVTSKTAKTESRTIPPPILHHPSRIISDFSFLLGRIVTENILDRNEHILVPAGALIVVETVKLCSNHLKLLDLTIKSRT